MEKYITHSVNETEELAAEFAKTIKGGDVFAFRGGLCMGKTAFSSGLLKGLKNPAFVSSPPFAIVNDYGGNPNVYHFDMYRIETLDDLESVGFFDYMSENSVLIIEWSENIDEYLPTNTIFIEIERRGDNDRQLSIYSATPQA